MLSHILARKIPYRLLRRCCLHVRVRIGRQTVVVPLHDPAALNWIYWKPGWKSMLFAQLLKQREGVLLDIGVNTGQSLADYLSTGLTNSYVGVEPNMRCLAYVQEVVRASALSGVTLVPVGLSDRSGLQRLFLEKGAPSDQGGSIREDLRPCKDTQSEWICTLPADDLPADLGLEKISLIKIDVEGAELEVLQGMPSLLRSQAPPILCEVLPADPHADMETYSARLRNLEALLDKHSYEIYRFMPAVSEDSFSLRKYSHFPVIRWSEEQSDAYDYLFVPPGALLPDWPVQLI